MKTRLAQRNRKVFPWDMRRYTRSRVPNRGRSAKKGREEEYLIPETLWLALFLARLCGIAPISFTKRDNVTYAKISYTMSIYSYLFVVFADLSIIIGTVIDFGLSSKHSVRMHSSMASAVWLAEVAVVMTIVNVGVFTGRRRVRQFLDYSTRIRKITAKFNTNDPNDVLKTNRNYMAGSAIVFVYSCVCWIWDLYGYIEDCYINDKSLQVTCMYIAYNIQNIVLVILEMQFVIIALLLHLTLKSLNDCIEGLITVIDLQLDTKFSSATDTIVRMGITEPKLVNIWIDSLTMKQSQTAGHIFYRDNYDIKSSHTLYTVQQTLRDLVMSYEAICGVMGKVNESNGFWLSLLLFSILLHLVITPYYFASYFFSASFHIGTLLLEVLFVIFHGGKLVMVVEPGQRMYDEISRTRHLVSQLASRSLTNSGLISEVDIFYKMIHLNNGFYSPLGICTLTRPLITAMLGGVTTYLVIILQFQAMDKDKN